MSEGSLSQEEIDALMAGGATDADPVASDTPEAADTPEPAGDWLTPSEIDTIGEVGNICMSSAATALSTLLGHQVQITTPTVAKVDEAELRSHFDSPAVVVVIEYTEGLAGRNVFVLTQRDASVVADLMMGGAGVPSDELSELHASAIGEAMNQMMGSASTAMAEMAGHRVDISAPSVAIIDLATLQMTGRIATGPGPDGLAWVTGR